MYEGYLSFGGKELINVARTAAYVENADSPIPLDTECIEQGDLRTALGDDVYDSPLIDDAPWFDPNNMATNRFYGLWPIDIAGVDDSTATAPVTESIDEGGSIGAERRATRAVRVKAMLLAADTQAMDAGMSWLDHALAPSPCQQHGTGTCGGSALCFFTSVPVVTRCWEPTYQAGSTIPLVRTTKESSPSIYRDIDSDNMWKGMFTLTETEGAIVAWGAVDDVETSKLVEYHGPVLLNRINYVIAPDFSLGNTGNWWTKNGVGTWAFTADGLVRTGGTAPSPATVRSGTMTGRAGEVVLSFDAAAAAPLAQFNVALREASTNNVIAQGNFELSPEMRRYSFSAASGQNVYFEITSQGDYTIARPMLEAGTIPLPYFQGNTDPLVANAGYIDTDQPEPQYAVSWASDPNAGVSRSAFIGKMWVGVRLDEPDFWLSQSGLCDAYPWLNILQGAVTGKLDMGVRLPIGIETQIEPFERTLHDTKRVQGPLKISDQRTSAGAVIRIVEFTIVAGKPGRYSSPVSVMDQTNMASLPTVTWVDIDCSDDTPVSIIDPDCPPVPAPPRPPTIPNACVTPETVWQRYWLTIPAENVSAWASTSLQATISSGSQEIRQVRVRAYPNPFNREVSYDPLWKANIAENPALYVDAAGWANAGAIGTATGRQGSSGTYWWRATATAAHAATTFGVSYGAPGHMEVIPGQEYRFAIDARPSVSREVQIRVAWLDAAGAQIGAAVLQDSFTHAANAWARHITGILTAPALAVRVVVQAIGTTTAWAAGQTLDATRAFPLTASELIGLDTTYFDGYTADAAGFYYTWLGDWGQSGSYAYTSPVDPCGYCSEFVVSYLPANTQLTVDAILERSYASINGAPAAPANHLLYAGDGTPIVWPELTCGQEYLLAIDVPEPLLDDVYVSVSVATKE